MTGWAHQIRWKNYLVEFVWFMEPGASTEGIKKLFQMRNLLPDFTKRWLVLPLLLTVGMFSCKSFEDQRNELPDNAFKGTIRISADESFKPVIDEQVKIYESQHERVKILVDYKPEAECLKDLPNDSVRMVIATRAASIDEKNFVSDTLKKISGV